MGRVIRSRGGEDVNVGLPGSNALKKEALYSSKTFVFRARQLRGEPSGRCFRTMTVVGNDGLMGAPERGLPLK